MRTSHLPGSRRTHRTLARVAALVVGLTGAGCDGILDIELPGRIPSGQLNDPSLAAVLVRSVVGDFECAYNNYFAGSAVHSDEYETANSNVPLANWGERSITSDEDDYAIGGCEATSAGGSNFGMHVPMHTARFQAEDVFNRLEGWTDEQVADRASLKATVRAYAGYTYTFLGETYCAVAFDGGPESPPEDALARAEERFTEAISLAQGAGNTDMLNLARVGLARVKLDLQKWSEAEAAAAQVPAGYEKLADRGDESDRRWNKVFYIAQQVGAYVVAPALRNLNDPRVLVAPVIQANGDTAPAFNPDIHLWVTTKYPDLSAPIRLASYREAQLIRAEALAEQGQIGPALAILNTRRQEVGLADVSAATQAEAISRVIEERRRELSFEGGHRLNDLLRRNIAWKVGANQFTARPYGTTTCWPFPTKERNGA